MYFFDINLKRICTYIVDGVELRFDLIFTTPWANSAHSKLIVCFLFFSENSLRHLM